MTSMTLARPAPKGRRSNRARNIENLHRWTDALRSGDFEQGKGFLMPAPNTFCCLGLGAKLAGCEVTRRADGIYLLDAEPMLPTAAFGEWLDVPMPHAGHFYVDIEGTSRLAGRFANYTGNLAESLSHLNDHGATFTEIADVIDEFGVYQ
jgi:hypothetical protein